MRFPLLSISYQPTQEILSKMNKSTHAEAVNLRGQDRLHVAHQLGLVLIRGQFEPIEAGVALWVRVVLVHLHSLDGELVDLVPVALQEGKAEDGHSARPSHEVQQVAQFLLVEGLHVLPEPGDLWVGGRVAHVECGSLPILDIDVLRAVEQHLYLMRLKHRQQLEGNDAVDGLLDLLHIALAAPGAEVVHQQVDVLLLVGVGYEDSAAVGFELNLLLLAGLPSEVGEGELQFLCAGVVEDVLPVVVHLPVVAVKVAELRLLPADLPPEAAREEAVQRHAVEEGLADDYTQQSAHLHPVLVLAFLLRAFDDEAIGRFVSMAQLEQPWDLAVEDVLHAQMHPFPQHPAGVVHYLSVKPDLHFLPQVDALEALVAGHDDVFAADLQPLAACLPTYAQLFHLDPQPGHLFLEAEVLDDAGLVVARLEGQQKNWLLGYGELDPFVGCGDLDVDGLPLILLEVVAVSPAHVRLVVGKFTVGPVRVVVIS